MYDPYAHKTLVCFKVLFPTKNMSTQINLSSPKTTSSLTKCAHQNLGVVAPEASLPSTIQPWELELLKVFRYIFYLANPNPQLGTNHLGHVAKTPSSRK